MGFGGTLCNGTRETKPHVCQEHYSYSNWSACNRLCGHGLKYRSAEKHICSATATVKSKFLFRQHALCTAAKATCDNSTEAATVLNVAIPAFSPVGNYSYYTANPINNSFPQTKVANAL